MACAARSAPPIVAGGRLQAPHRLRIEAPLDPGSGTRSGRETSRVDDLVRVPPDLGEFPDEGRLIARGGGYPVEHGFVHAAAVEVGTDRSLQVVDEAKDLLVRLGPVKAALGIFDVAVQ